MTRTFSNLSLTGLGFIAVTVSTMSFPMLKACSLVAPLSSTNKLKKEDASGTDSQQYT